MCVKHFPDSAASPTLEIHFFLGLFLGWSLGESGTVFIAYPPEGKGNFFLFPSDGTKPGALEAVGERVEGSLQGQPQEEQSVPGVLKAKPDTHFLFQMMILNKYV